MARAPSVKRIALPSGVQPRPPIERPSDLSRIDSRPSESERTMRSPPPAPPPRPPRPAGAAGGALPPGADVERTNATLVPSGDGVMPDSICGVVHTADAVVPSIGTCQRSPPFDTISDFPSALQ